MRSQIFDVCAVGSEFEYFGSDNGDILITHCYTVGASCSFNKGLRQSTANSEQAVSDSKFEYRRPM